MGKPVPGSRGTFLSFSRPHSSPSGDNHVDGYRYQDGRKDDSYAPSNPGTQHVKQSDGYGSKSASVPVNKR